MAVDTSETSMCETLELRSTLIIMKFITLNYTLKLKSNIKLATLLLKFLFVYTKLSHLEKLYNEERFFQGYDDYFKSTTWIIVSFVYLLQASNVLVLLFFLTKQLHTPDIPIVILRITKQCFEIITQVNTQNLVGIVFVVSIYFKVTEFK